jgi:hypothetical protein
MIEPTGGAKIPVQGRASEPRRRQWMTPRVILSEASSTENGPDQLPETPNPPSAALS